MRKLGEDHPAGAIIIAGGEFLRFGGFLNSMMNTMATAPHGTMSMIKQSVSIVSNLNDCIRELPETHQWIWIQSDDQMWEPMALRKLLDREVDVVVPLILRRGPPFTPLIFKDYYEGMGYMPYGLDELPSEGLMDVFVAGSGGMLVRRHVLEAVGWPKDAPWNERHWFEYEQGEHLNEDFVFCRKVREAGFKIWCDVEVQMGHRGMMTAWPLPNDDGSWSLGLNLGAATHGKSNTIVINSEAIKEAVA